MPFKAVNVAIARNNGITFRCLANLTWMSGRGGLVLYPYILYREILEEIWMHKGKIKNNRQSLFAHTFFATKQPSRHGQVERLRQKRPKTAVFGQYFFARTWFDEKFIIHIYHNDSKNMCLNLVAGMPHLICVYRKMSFRACLCKLPRPNSARETLRLVQV